ncbi:sensor histidine kinase [Nonomuraea africana]|uniref:histidine kinase n=1 Tax=Nonomuraea africana TaxID=46171 RepID=A0ABR9KU76_9ACTN|nr:histidine kinase [Nonomuraea africana]MBE1565578.1 signal transduction histidine kinase [Nonomuraea africana]
MNVRDRLAARPDVVAIRGVRVAADTGLAAAFAGLLAFWAYRISDSWGGGYWQFGCAAGALVCGLALARRRGRAWAAVAGLAVAAAAVLASRFAELPAEPGPAMALGLSVLVGSAVRALPGLAAYAVAAGGLAVALGSLLTAHSAGSAVPSVTTLNLGGWLAGVAFGVSGQVLAVRRRTMADAVRRHERLQLARELHDVVAHHITGIVLQAQAGQVLVRKQPDRLGGALSGIESAGSDALAAMRRLVGLLREAEGATLALGPERLSDLIERFDGPEVRLRLPDGDNEPAWPPEVTTTVYRVVREALINVSRHAPHARTVDVTVTVTVALDRDTVTVEVADDAPPVAARHHHRRGYGLLGMRERLEALGGTLDAGPRQGGGWSVRATLPLPARERR